MSIALGGLVGYKAFFSNISISVRDRDAWSVSINPGRVGSSTVT